MLTVSVEFEGTEKSLVKIYVKLFFTMSSNTSIKELPEGNTEGRVESFLCSSKSSMVHSSPHDKFLLSFMHQFRHTLQNFILSVEGNS